MSKDNISVSNLVEQLIYFLNNDVLLGALQDYNIEDSVCFDCSLWIRGYKTSRGDPKKTTIIIPPISKTFITILCETELLLDYELCNMNCRDYGYKSQLERFLFIIRDLKYKVESVRCIDTCSDNNIVSYLLSTLIQTILLLTTSLEYNNSLITYSNNCGCSSIVFTDLLMGKFINSITELQCLLQDWYSIIIAFLSYSFAHINPYIASYVPKQPIPAPKPPTPMYHACVPYPHIKEPCPPPHHIHNNYIPFPYR